MRKKCHIFYSFFICEVLHIIPVWLQHCDVVDCSRWRGTEVNAYQVTEIILIEEEGVARWAGSRLVLYFELDKMPKYGT